MKILIFFLNLNKMNKKFFILEINLILKNIYVIWIKNNYINEIIESLTFAKYLFITFKNKYLIGIINLLNS